MFQRDTVHRIGWTLAGSAILAFGLYNIHSLSGVTEGGILGATLLLQHWFAISPAVSSLVLNATCYLMGWKILGHQFLLYSAVAGVSFSAFYGIAEQFPPLWPQIAAHPLLAAVLGAVFVGIGAGLGVRCGGASGGDDALAMSINRLANCGVEKVYLISDILVLALSISYIPLPKLAYSLLTVILSGQLIGWVQRAKLPFLPKPL